MYERFYGLRERPFSLLPDPSFLFVGRQHGHALALLEYALAHGSGFALVTGEVGSGKTTLIRHTLGKLDDGVTVGLIHNTHRGMTSLLPWVANSLGVPIAAKTEPEVYEAFVATLVEAYRQGRRVVLIIDEAQNLNAAALEELRVLSNLNSEKDLLLQTILVGQPELRDTLRHPRMLQLAQRIAIDYHLGKLSREETHSYVRHRLEVAGATREIMTGDAIEMLNASTGGVPRLINSICDTALVYGFAEQARQISAEIVGQVLRDRAAGGILPMESPAVVS
jgi:type II secretory pathway predicted ATPase ExeA